MTVQVQQLLSDLRSWVDAGALNESVVAALLPAGEPHAFETELWDYKVKGPQPPAAGDEDDKKRYKVEVAELAKDAVSFHNGYGGYVLFGVAAKGVSRLVGWNGDFDVGEFNKAVEGYTGTSIECLFRSIEIQAPEGTKPVGLLLIPRRGSNAPPVKFRRKGPEKADGKPIFLPETYVRRRDQCRPAVNNHEDWLFLHSGREPIDTSGSPPQRHVQASLPPRDPDLIEFVGREEQLATLRGWILDTRSPVRLLTGIGGLGKTTLANRFAEEEAETGGGDIDWVIWLTAKKQTYSALQGKLVSTKRVDFSGLNDLLNEILRILAYELPSADEEPMTEELVDRAVEALSIVPCLIVVDDIDSLEPEDQKETVAALNTIALRTVGREMPPTRILMTSRIDQGLPPTAVIKVSGLEPKPFATYVSNITQLFGMEPFPGHFVAKMHKETYGSPLFAASVARLVRLGENATDVLDRWAGQDGEDVRKFAFERELDRLTGVQSKLLYAVLLLGETSLNDLATILEITPRAVRDRLTELQAYHLVSTAVRDAGETVIQAPDELEAITELLRSHLGSASADVDEACARAAERSRNDNRTIGLAIRTIVGHWSSGRAAEAIILAKELRERYPKSGDVASIYGAALLKAAPPRFKDADIELDSARRLGCERPELTANIITAKSAIEDWQGLYNFTKPLSSRDPRRDIALEAYLAACTNLIGTAEIRGDDARAADLALEVVEKIGMKIERVRLDPQFFQSISSRRLDFARKYVAAVDRANPRRGDRLRVFEAVLRLQKSGVVLRDLVRFGVQALADWWEGVEARSSVDLAACSLLSRQLAHLDAFERMVQAKDPTLANWLNGVSRDLAYRGAALQGEIGA